MYTHTTFSLSVHSLTDTGCFSVLAIVNDAAALNRGVQITFQVSIFISFWYILRCGLLGDMVVLLLNFWETPYSLAPIYNPINTVTGIPFSRPFISSFWWLPFWQAWYLTVVFICIFLMTSDVKHLFMYLLVFRIVFFGKTSGLLPIFFTGLFEFFCCWTVWVLYVFWY